jgi:hypothetical protein
MTTLKTLAIVSALLVGGVSLAIAQGPPTGGYPPVAGGAAGNPAVPAAPGPPGPGVIPMPNKQSAAPARHATRHHLYLSNRAHKGSKMNQ